MLFYERQRKYCLGILIKHVRVTVYNFSELTKFNPKQIYYIHLKSFKFDNAEQVVLYNTLDNFVILYKLV